MHNEVKIPFTRALVISDESCNHLLFNANLVSEIEGSVYTHVICLLSFQIAKNNLLLNVERNGRGFYINKMSQAALRTYHVNNKQFTSVF